MFILWNRLEVLGLVFDLQEHVSYGFDQSEELTLDSQWPDPQPAVSGLLLPNVTTMTMSKGTRTYLANSWKIWFSRTLLGLSHSHFLCATCRLVISGRLSKLFPQF